MTKDDLLRENKVLTLLQERFSDWQKKGVIPSRTIERGGEKTEEPIRTRGWSSWHHLFNARQLLVHGCIAINYINTDKNLSAAKFLLIGKLANWNSRITQWLESQGGGKQSSANQALNTFYN